MKDLVILCYICNISYVSPLTQGTTSLQFHSRVNEHDMAGKLAAINYPTLIESGKQKRRLKTIFSFFEKN